MELSDAEIAEHRSFMAALGVEASERGYIPPMNMVQSYSDTEGAGAVSLARVRSLKEEGNCAMASGKYEEAWRLYTEALETVHGSQTDCGILHVLFGNRSAALLKMGRAAEAAEDGRSSVLADPKYVKGWFRIANACAVLGDNSGKRDAAERGLQLDPRNRELLEILRS